MQMNFPRDMIVNRGFYLVPTSTLGTFVAGSTYEHAPFSEGPSDKGLRHITGRLEEWFNEPFEVIHQDWGIRPTVSDRRPLLGSHPEAQNVVIFSGLGTKGVSLAPYFASSLVDWIEGKSVLPEVVNISRFMSLYSN